MRKISDHALIKPMNKVNHQCQMRSRTYLKTKPRMLVHEQLSILLLLPANILYAIAAGTHDWFELPGIAKYGLWWARFCDLDVCIYVPAFFSDEPLFYHLLQVMCLFSWGGLFLSLFMLMSNKMDHRIPKFLGKNRHQTIALICFSSVFVMTTALYLFYYIINDFRRQTDLFPEIKWAAVFASAACGFQFLAGLLMLQV